MQQKNKNALKYGSFLGMFLSAASSMLVIISNYPLPPDVPPVVAHALMWAVSFGICIGLCSMIEDHSDEKEGQA